MQEQIENIYSELANIKSRLNNLEQEGQAGEEGGETEPSETEEYPEYKQPQGAHDAYKMGDKITFEGEHYTCNMNGCVWSPKEYPNAWIKE